MRTAYKISDAKCEGKKPLGRSRHRDEDNVIINLKKSTWICGLHLFGSGQEFMTDLRGTWDSIKYG